MSEAVSKLMQGIDYSKEFELLVEAYEKSGGTPEVLKSDKYASLAIHGNHVLGKNEVRGLRVETVETEHGVRVRVRVEPGVRIQNPVHLCFGLVPEEGLQEIISDFEIGENAEVGFIAHCSFPNALRIKHVMDSTIRLRRGAKMIYSETHFHGDEGGIEVFPKTRAFLEEGAVFENEFKLVKGAVGRLAIDFAATVGEKAVCEVYAKVYGKGEDNIVVSESLHLVGARAKGLAKSRIAVTDRARSEVVGEIVGDASYSRGHVDCVEVIRGRDAEVSAVPRLLVRDDTAKLTHEAAIGSVDKKQVETLMARGLTEDEAVDVIVSGMLR